MPKCANGFGACSCFASGCGYVGEDFQVHGCHSDCCQGRCPGQVGKGVSLAYGYNPDSKKYVLTLGLLLLLLVTLSTLSL
jgi:hypothetical protein